MSTEQMTPETETLRERAVKRLRKKRDFHVHLLLYVTVNAFLVLVWLLTGPVFFWPVIPMAGWGIGVIANAWDVYASDVPTESQIRREMDKLSERP